jgi:hypothetical protein
MPYCKSNIKERRRERRKKKEMKREEGLSEHEATARQTVELLSEPGSIRSGTSFLHPPCTVEKVQSSNWPNLKYLAKER